MTATIEENRQNLSTVQSYSFHDLMELSKFDPAEKTGHDIITASDINLTFQAGISQANNFKLVSLPRLSEGNGRGKATGYHPIRLKNSEGKEMQGALLPCTILFRHQNPEMRWVDIPLEITNPELYRKAKFMADRDGTSIDDAVEYLSKTRK